MANRDRATIIDIFFACDDILRYTQGMSWQDFYRDDKTQASVAYKVTVIGEAVRRLSDAFKAEHAQIPWRKITDARNVVTHMYDDVEIEQLWKIVTRSIPELEAYVRELLPSEIE